MRRCESLEILDGNDVSSEELMKSYKQLEKLQTWLGNTRAMLRLLRRSSEKINTVLDIGCGHGGLLMEIRKKLNVDVIGFDLRPAPHQSAVPIVTGNAVTDPLPDADVAVSMMMAHHLSEVELDRLIQNVTRSCKRFILMDLVRHPVPLTLFRTFLAPGLRRINALDGETSIRRAFTADEMLRIVERALAAGNRPVKSVRHSVGPLWTRQIVDIVWEHAA